MKRWISEIGDQVDQPNPTVGPWSDREIGHLLALPCILPSYWEYRAGNFCYPISVIFWGRYRKEKKTSFPIPHRPPSSIPRAYGFFYSSANNRTERNHLLNKDGNGVGVVITPDTFRHILRYLAFFCMHFVFLAPQRISGVLGVLGQWFPQKYGGTIWIIPIFFMFWYWISPLLQRNESVLLIHRWHDIYHWRVMSCYLGFHDMGCLAR